LVPEEP